MAWSCLDCEFIRYLIEEELRPGDRLPSLVELSNQIGISVSKLREQLEVARTLGLVEASPRRGITRTEYSFLPPVRLSLLTAIELDRSRFEQYSELRIHLETAYWDEAIASLTSDETALLQGLVQQAKAKLSGPRIQIPYPEHRNLHLTIFSRLNNPFVVGLLEAYWDAYEAVELNTYADLSYLKEVWDYHGRIVDAICAHDEAAGKRLLIEHMGLLSKRGIAVHASLSEAHVAA
ncbi:MAG: FadR/GntR family transcriptional regulator [Caldilineaceae bacterium]